MDNLLLHNKPAVKVFADRIVKWSPNSRYLCEGIKIWLRNDFTQYDDTEKTIIIEQWYYNKRFNIK